MRGIAIPIFWHLLDKAGNGSALEHQAILERFVRVFGKERIAGVLGDREFASGDLFGWCNQEGIPFYIRIKEGSLVKAGKKRVCKAKEFFSDLKLKEKKEFPMSIDLFGQKVYLAGSRSERGELMIVATNRTPSNAIACYLRRWEIECLFGSLKSKGFRFEDTHVTKLERIERLMVLLVIGFCWAHKTGEWRATRKPIPFNKHRDSRRPQYSFFRYGFDLIRDALVNATDPKLHLMAALEIHFLFLQLLP
jgi:hypothetical protein